MASEDEHMEDGGEAAGAAGARAGAGAGAAAAGPEKARAAEGGKVGELELEVCGAPRASAAGGGGGVVVGGRGGQTEG